MKILNSLFGFLILVSAFSNAETLDSKKAAAEVIVDLSNKICTMPSTSGSTDNLELTIDAKAELGKALKKVGALGAKAGAKYVDSSYRGVLQKDLANIIKNNADCKVAVLHELKDKLLDDHPSKVIVNSGEASNAHGKSTVASETIMPSKFPIDAKLMAGQTRKFFDGLQITVLGYGGTDGKMTVTLGIPAMGSESYDFKVGREGAEVEIRGIVYQISVTNFDSELQRIGIRIQKIGRV